MIDYISNMAEGHLVIYLLQVATALFGVFATFFSLVLARKFWRLREKLGRAMGWAMCAEAVVSAATVIFAITSVFEYYNTLSPLMAMGIRVFMFSVAIGSSYHVWRTMRLL